MTSRGHSQLWDKITRLTVARLFTSVELTPVPIT